MIFFSISQYAISLFFLYWQNIFRTGFIIKRGGNKHEKILTENFYMGELKNLGHWGFIVGEPLHITLQH